MEQFPTLTDGQVALLRAEIATGHVLDEYLRLTTDNNQKVYTVFNTYNEAFLAASKIVSSGKVECIIYDADKKVLKYLVV